MAKKYDFQKEWPKVKKEISRLGDEALKLVKKGEVEFRKLSKQGKVYLDATALNLKKEHLFVLIGKEYVKGKGRQKQSAALKKLLAEMAEIDKQLKQLSLKKSPLSV